MNKEGDKQVEGEAQEADGKVEEGTNLLKQEVVVQEENKEEGQTKMEAMEPRVESVG